MSRLFRGILIGLLTLPGLISEAGAQQLYIPKVNVWYRNVGGTGYCNDVDASVTVVPVSGPVAGGLGATVTGTYCWDTNADFVADTCDNADTVVVAGAFNGTVSGNLAGYDYYASGPVNGNLAGAASGVITGAGQGNGQTLTCTPNPIAAGAQTVYATGDFGGTFTAPYVKTSVAGFTCRNISTTTWTWNANVGVGGVSLAGNVSGTLTGVSNGPDIPVGFYTGGPTHNPVNESALIEYEQPQGSYPGGCLGLCATVDCVSTGVGSFGIDKLEFEVFKFGSGANPLDPASTPPIRTIALSDIGTCPGYQSTAVHVGTYCTAWDGSYNLDGLFGKTNGQFGFRAKVETNQVSPTAGNISITQTVAYPGQTQQPISVNVVNVHTIRSTPTVVGRITGVAAQPYNLLYRLSKDANVDIHIHGTSSNASIIGAPVRHIVDALPRVGEGTPGGTLTNGDFWDGRDEYGSLVSTGVYIAFINASELDYYGLDSAYGATAYMSVDPLQITDIAIKPLGASSTDQAIISYFLTEAATVYVGIYSPGTSFLNANTSPPTISPGTGNLLRLITEQKTGRQTVSTYWDGKDNAGNVLPDADYAFGVYAAMPTSAAWGGVIKTQKTMTGIIPVARGLVVSFITPSETVMGSSPSVAGLDPFFFRYTPVRSATFSMNILPLGSTTPVKHLVIDQPRTANFSEREVWNGKNDIGQYVPSGVYQAELIARDSLTAGGVSTTTVRFSVDMFRIVDVRTTPLLGGASDNSTISFEMTQPMYIDLKIYPVNVTIVSSATVNPADWPILNPSAYTLVYRVSGVRPGRFRITEYWDGRNTFGTPVPDGRYPFSLTARSSGTAQVMYAVDQVYGYVDVARGVITFAVFDIVPNIPTLYNSSDTVTLPPYEIDYMLSRQSEVRVEILRQEDQMPVATVVPVDLGTGYEFREGAMPIRDYWDGRCTTNTQWCRNNDFVSGGAYDVRVIAHDIGASLTSAGATVQQTIDVHPLRIFDMAVTPMTPDTQAAAISYQVSEPMTVVTKIYRPGTSLASCTNIYETKDGCYNNLVKMFAGVRPARTLINEYWDGTDRTLSHQPDGNYVFKVYGSTSTTSVSMITGQLSAGAVRVEDVVVANLPVVNGPTANDEQLEADTFFYPNPYTGVAGKFHLPIYATSEVNIKIYNLAGDLVFTYASGVQGSGQIMEVPWPKTNDSGNTVAHGVYFAVIRYEGRDGGKGELQMVKKILIP